MRPMKLGGWCRPAGFLHSNGHSPTIFFVTKRRSFSLILVAYVDDLIAVGIEA